MIWITESTNKLAGIRAGNRSDALSMAYHAQIIRIMIASPSDCAAEQQVIESAIHDWNSAHSAPNGFALLPVHWRSHAAPSMSDRPQAVINKQVLQDCDLLIATFWTRLGSPTGAAPSGTVEEIQEHLRAGKPAMIYFSNAPAHPQTVDSNQLEAVHEIRKAFSVEGLVHTYDSIEQFANALHNHLAMTINREFGALLADPIDALFADAETYAPSSITPDAAELLKEASVAKNGMIMMYGTFGGAFLQTNGRNFITDGSPQTRARWKAALDELIDEGAVEERGHKGEVFAVTHHGYELAKRVNPTGTL
jgi:hypothetical protein